MFAAHHVLLNPITSALGPELKAALERHGAALKVIFAEGWGATDAPFSVANCKQLFMYFPQIPDRLDFLTLRPTGSTAFTIKAMKPPEYLAGTSVKATLCGNNNFFLLAPSEECVGDMLDSICAPRRAAVREDGGPHAPSQSALGMGKVNPSFRVFVRIRPMLKREVSIGSASCVLVEDVIDFPREPPPQRIKVFDPALLSDADGGSSEGGSEGGGADIAAVLSRQAQKGEYIFDRVFEGTSTQQEVFDMVAKPLAQAVLDGTNSTIFAYGQTGTGKTFTMEGPDGHSNERSQGVMYRWRRWSYSYSCCTQAVLMLHSYCTQAVLILYSCCTQAALMLHSCCAHAVLILYSCCTHAHTHAALILHSYCTHAALILYSCCTNTALILYSCCTHAALMLHLCCTHAVLMLYSCCTHAVLILYSCCTVSHHS
jgi:hypothetical protein